MQDLIRFILGCFYSAHPSRQKEFSDFYTTKFHEEPFF